MAMNLEILTTRDQHTLVPVKIITASWDPSDYPVHADMVLFVDDGSPNHRRWQVVPIGRGKMVIDHEDIPEDSTLIFRVLVQMRGRYSQPINYMVDVGDALWNLPRSQAVWLWKPDKDRFELTEVSFGKITYRAARLSERR